MSIDSVSSLYIDPANSWRPVRPQSDKARPGGGLLFSLDSVDARITAGLAILRGDANACDFLDQASELISLMLRRLALSATREPAKPTRSKALRSGGLTPRKERQLTEYIALRLAERLSIAELASIVGLSRSYFCLAFRVTFNLSPRQFIEARRIERAQQLMMATDQPLAQISLACGFKDAAHFSKTFRGVTGHSPSRWRRMHLDCSSG